MEIFSFIPIAHAQADANPCTDLGGFSTLCNLTSNDFGLVVSTAINIILIIAIILAVFFFMYGGIKWILSRGDKEKLEDAKSHIIASVVGLVMVLFVFFIVNIIVGFFFPGKSLKDLTLPSLGPDTKAPTISITSPLPDSTVSGITTIQANATDNKQVAKVEFYVDDILKNTDKTEPFSYNWDAGAYKHNSTHTILLKAYDAAGNIGTSAAINVVVIDVAKPSITIINPVNEGKIVASTTIVISAQVSDASAISQVEFRVNGISKCTDYEAPYTCTWKAPAAKGVIYRIEASAQDIAGNVGTSANSVTAL
jgi:hypothetical protein